VAAVTGFLHGLLSLHVVFWKVRNLWLRQ